MRKTMGINSKRINKHRYYGRMPRATRMNPGVGMVAVAAVVWGLAYLVAWVVA